MDLTGRFALALLRESERTASGKVAVADQIIERFFSGAVLSQQLHDELPWRPEQKDQILRALDLGHPQFAEKFAAAAAAVAPASVVSAVNDRLERGEQVPTPQLSLAGKHDPSLWTIAFRCCALTSPRAVALFEYVAQHWEETCGARSLVEQTGERIAAGEDASQELIGLVEWSRYPATAGLVFAVADLGRPEVAAIYGKTLASEKRPDIEATVVARIVRGGAQNLPSAALAQRLRVETAALLKTLDAVQLTHECAAPVLERLLAAGEASKKAVLARSQARIVDQGEQASAAAWGVLVQAEPHWLELFHSAAETRPEVAAQVVRACRAAHGDAELGRTMVDWLDRGQLSRALRQHFDRAWIPRPSATRQDFDLFVWRHALLTKSPAVTPTQLALWAGALVAGAEHVEWRQGEWDFHHDCVRPYAGVFNAATGAVEWRQGEWDFHHDCVRPYAGVFNAATGAVEWRQGEWDFHHDCVRPYAGVFNAATGAVEWRQGEWDFHHDCVRPYAGVFNAATGAVEWRQAEWDLYHDCVRPYAGVGTAAAQTLSPALRSILMQRTVRAVAPASIGDEPTNRISEYA